MARRITAPGRTASQLLMMAVLASPTWAQRESESSFVLRSFDGFEMNGMIESAGEPAEQKRVIILVHGSGPHSMDSDLTAVTINGEKNLFFSELSAALHGEGFAVVRYDKRSYAQRKKAGTEPEFAGSRAVKAFIENPLQYFVDDVKACVNYAQARMPDASVYLLGHSQGTYIALQSAREHDAIKGVALIGFATSPMTFLQFEQLVYRSLRGFRRLDTNGDEALDARELQSEDPFAATLRAQAGTLDADGDRSITRLEFQAASMVPMILAEPFAGAYLKQEATYPRIADVLHGAEFTAVFLQGLLDNQTPAYHAKAIEITNTKLWKKNNLHFHYFAGLGHALDPRDNYDDLRYRRADAAALTKVARVLDEAFR